MALDIRIIVDNLLDDNTIVVMMNQTQVDRYSGSIEKNRQKQ